MGEDDPLAAAINSQEVEWGPGAPVYETDPSIGMPTDIGTDPLRLALDQYPPEWGAGAPVTSGDILSTIGSAGSVAGGTGLTSGIASLLSAVGQVFAPAPSILPAGQYRDPATGRLMQRNAAGQVVAVSPFTQPAVLIGGAILLGLGVWAMQRGRR